MDADRPDRDLALDSLPEGARYIVIDLASVSMTVTKEATLAVAQREVDRLSLDAARTNLKVALAMCALKDAYIARLIREELAREQPGLTLAPTEKPSGRYGEPTP